MLMLIFVLFIFIWANIVKHKSIDRSSDVVNTSLKRPKDNKLKVKNQHITTIQLLQKAAGDNERQIVKFENQVTLPKIHEQTK